jgi:hypothetical protein
MLKCLLINSGIVGVEPFPHPDYTIHGVAQSAVECDDIFVVGSYLQVDLRAARCTK